MAVALDAISSKQTTHFLAPGCVSPYFPVTIQPIRPSVSTVIVTIANAETARGIRNRCTRPTTGVSRNAKRIDKAKQIDTIRVKYNVAIATIAPTMGVATARELNQDGPKSICSPQFERLDNFVKQHFTSFAEGAARALRIGGRNVQA